MQAKDSDRRYLAGLVIGALGVVFGDIGTSPLYALRECFHGEHAVAVTRANILGVLSLIFWSLLIIVSIKYLTFVMRADNKGEGGILALLSLALGERAATRRRAHWLTAIGLFGAALLYGDGMITPAISVLSAVEGLQIASPVFQTYIIPITAGILVALFSVQRFGTGRVGITFGPVTFAWFVTIAVLGIKGILQSPDVLLSLHPYYAVRFFADNGSTAFLALGAVFLAVTGAEALYADMGHFGVKPIRFGWFALVLPSLLLNYWGQGALLLNDPGAAVNPFYSLPPKWALYPMVVLATMAAVIASQALISGVFSLTMHAIQLGYFPRLEIKHTSSDERGQIYLPQVNWALMVACIGLVLGFQSSSNLAAAYGIAVTLTMIVTTILFYNVARHLWGWSLWKTSVLCSSFLLLETAFCGANFLKITHGGWFPLVMGAFIYTLMTTWKTGRQLLRERLQAATISYRLFLDDLLKSKPLRVAGTAVFMAGNPEGTPIALLHNLKHNKVLHERTVVLTIATEEMPHVNPEHRIDVECLHDGFYRVIGRYGFMEEPSVSEVLKACETKGLKFVPEQTTYFLSRESIIPTQHPGMAIWRERLFAIMARNAQPATTFFRLPANRVVELGMQVEL
ncbi:MAG: potassium transporter Kup [Verrucomicrobia bacterium]|nr:potassium transporter Kup [Verrucomicrobiota bacterium]